ncbi:MAG: hypothetical protein NWR72_08645 [Bacteroidia bacterium]|nr:hypothetical protein [Bacteroidia bacterium]
MQQYTWIFSLLTPVGTSTAEQMTQAFEAFQAQWKTHGTPVQGLIKLHHNQFVVIQAKNDDSRPSGCSIDSLRRAVTSILEQHRLPWAEGGEIFFRNASGDIQMVHFQQIKALVADGTLNEDSIVFDHSLSNSDDLSLWEVPLADTWMKRFLPSETKQKV